MNQRLIVKAVFITGGGSWIGKEIAVVFAREGATVFIVGRNEQKLRQTVSEITQAGGVAFYFVADISDKAAINQAVKEAMLRCGKIDTVIQNAVVYPSVMIEKMDLHEWIDAYVSFRAGKIQHHC